MGDRRAAVVTGAASGIGRAVAQRLRRDGWRVVAADVARDALVWVDGDPDLVACVADVATEEGNEAMVAAALERFGRLDGLVLNAGVGLRGALDEPDAVHDFDVMLAVNLRALVLGLRAALPALRASRGAVTVTASVSGLGADTIMWGYNASKGGAVNFVRAAAFDLGPEGIRVNAVCPGLTRGTGMTAPMEDRAPEVFEEMRLDIPLQRAGTPEEVAAVHAFLLSDDASFVTGVAVPVDGGVTCGSGQFRPGPSRPPRFQPHP